MIRLPGKLVLLPCFIILITILFFTTAESASAEDIFGDPWKNCIEAEKQAKKDEAGNDSTRIFSCRVNFEQTGETILNTTGYIISLDPEYHPATPTALNSVIDVIALTYTHPPASGLAYINDVLANAGLVKPAYAQGIGFAGLAPLLPIWKASRDIAYSVIVLVMLAIGFMVIFRMKIDPKTVISVQAALPRIVITLILITLSYPIVGFLIDVMYLVMAILISLMGSGMNLPDEQIAQLQSIYMTGGIRTLFGAVFQGGAALKDFLKLFVEGGLITLGAAKVAGGLGIFFAFFQGWLPLIAGFALPSIIFLAIIVLGLLFTFIRLLLLLVNSYIQILINLILGPIILLGEAIPGRSAFSRWLLNIMANLSVFPTTVAVLLFAVFLITSDIDAPLWSPPLMGIPEVRSGPQAARTSPFAAFLGLTVILVAPTLVARVKNIFKPQPFMPITAGTAMAPLTGAVSTGLGAGQQFFYTASLLSQARQLIKGGERGRDH